MDSSNLARRLADDQVAQLWVIFHDYNGRACAKIVPQARFAEALERGLAVAHANLDFTMDDQQASGARFLANTGDFRAVPDPASYRLVPYRPGTARVHTWLRAESPEQSSVPQPWDGCPRTRLQAQVDAYAAAGWSVQVGFEPEFTLFVPAGDREYQPADHEPMYSLSGLDLHAAFWERLLDSLAAMGITVEQFGKEYGPGQYELNLGHGAPLKAVDDYLAFKDTVHHLAREAGFVATFMPKPYAHLVGNGLHLHLSVWDAAGTRELSCADSAGEVLSPLGRHFLGGLLAHAPALTGIGAPIVNSYKRLLPGSWAPAHICWGLGNRAALVRVPGRGGRRHVEFRAGDNACNPYFFLTVLLAAGLDGLRREIEPPPPLTEDAGHFSADEATAQTLGFLPRTLPEALAAAEADSVIAEALGPVCFPEFLKVKRHELATYDLHVHPWERRTYLEAL